MYCKISNISHTKSKTLVFLVSASGWLVQYIEAKCSVENEDVVGAAPTGNAP